MSVFRLIHLSDIHLTPFIAPSWVELCSKRITGWLNWKFGRAHSMGEQVLAHLIADMQRQTHDHLVISGDLVNLSLSREFVQARLWLEQLGSSADVSLTFGNHDAYVPGALKRACQIFAPWIEADEGWQAHKFEFPYCRLRGEVAIIGLNSARATRPFSARGYFRKSQAVQLAEILVKTQGFFRVVVIHHPPIHNAVARHKILCGIDLFQEVIAAQGAELILHGHSHEPTLHFIKGQNKTQVPVVGVASGSQGLGGHKSPASMNIFEIKRSAKDWHCRLIRRALVNNQGDFSETEVREF